MFSRFSKPEDKQRLIGKSSEQIQARQQRYGAIPDSAQPQLTEVTTSPPATERTLIAIPKKDVNEAKSLGKRLYHLLGETGFFLTYVGAATLASTALFIFADALADGVRLGLALRSKAATQSHWIDSLKNATKFLILLFAIICFAIPFYKHKRVILSQTMSRVAGNTRYRILKTNPPADELYTYKAREKFYLSRRRELVGDVNIGLLQINQQLRAIMLCLTEEASTEMPDEQQRIAIMQQAYLNMYKIYYKLASIMNRLEGFLAVNRQTLGATHQDKLDQAVKDTDNLCAITGKLKLKKVVMKKVANKAKTKLNDPTLFADQELEVKQIKARENRLNLQKLRDGLFFNPTSHQKPDAAANESLFESHPALI